MYFHIGLLFFILDYCFHIGLFRFPTNFDQKNPTSKSNIMIIFIQVIFPNNTLYLDRTFKKII